MLKEYVFSLMFGFMIAWIGAAVAAYLAANRNIIGLVSLACFAVGQYMYFRIAFHGIGEKKWKKKR